MFTRKVSWDAIQQKEHKGALYIRLKELLL